MIKTAAPEGIAEAISLSAVSRPEAMRGGRMAAAGSAFWFVPSPSVHRPRVQGSRAVEPEVDVVWGQPAAGDRAYASGERTPREALALRLFVFLTERDARLAAERGDQFHPEAVTAVGSAAA